MPNGVVIPSDIDAQLQGLERKSFAKVSARLFSSSRSSHVLLSACGEKERAWEENARGRFTTALLALLKNVNSNTMTYIDLIRRLPLLPS